MSAKSRKVLYAHEGILIFPDRVPEIDENAGPLEIAHDGFILVQVLRPKTYLAQSASNGQLYFVKSLTFSDEVPAKQVGRAVFTYDEGPPDYRISASNHAAACVLPQYAQFPELIFFQRPTGDDWDLYFEYLNGGDLENVIREHYAHQRRIPESFIWHVAAEIGWAFLFMHRGQRIEDAAPQAGWRTIYHRSIHESNIMINYPTRRGKTSRAGSVPNAFPDILLCDWGDSAMATDNRYDITRGTFPGETYPQDWEDIYNFGCVLRRMCMAHVQFPAHGNGPAKTLPGQVKDESRLWFDRPDSRRLAAVNAHDIGPAYSDDLINMLAHFEWPNQENSHIEDGANRTHVPDIDWVLDVLLTEASRKVQNYLVPGKPEGYYDRISVYWTKDYSPMPFVADRNRIEELDTIRRNVGMHKRVDIGGLKYSSAGLVYPLGRDPPPL